MSESRVEGKQYKGPSVGEILRRFAMTPAEREAYDFRMKVRAVFEGGQ